MYKLYHNVLGAEANGALYRFALDRQAQFTNSKVSSESAAYTDWRRSTVIYDRDIGTAAARLAGLVRERMPEVVRALGMARFEVSHVEMQLTSHNDGEYFRWHTDNGTLRTAARTVTFVYYFHGIPKRFSGGELILYDEDGSRTTIPPDNDTLVFFLSNTKHEVCVTNCLSRLFGDGRFTLNGWVHRPIYRPRPDYFDAKIFGPRTALATARRRTPAPVQTPPASGSCTNAADGLQDYAAGMFHLLGELKRISGAPQEVVVRTEIDRTTFFREFYFKNVPLIVKGAIASSAAVRTWSLDYLERECGRVRVPITSGRSDDADYEMNFADSVQQTSIAGLVRRLREEPQSNDYYLVARNNAFALPALKALRDQVTAPGDIIDLADESPTAIKLWLGPKGTVTPLHYDKHSILFAQVFGRKHFKLIPPCDAPLLAMRRRYYSAIDPIAPDLQRYPQFALATVLDVIVEAGDVLFLPVGWWHWVKALEISASVTFSSFRINGRNTPLRLAREDQPELQAPGRPSLASMRAKVASA